jgi:hypothetical protein
MSGDKDEESEVERDVGHGGADKPPPPPPPPGPPLPPAPPPPEDGGPISSIPLEPPPESVPRPRPVPPPTKLPAPVIDEVEPASGYTIGGTKITLRGQNLFRESIVRIAGSIAGTVGAKEPREIQVTTPSRPAPGPVDVSVQNPGADLVVAEKAFHYESLPAPTIESVAPNHVAAKGGAEITVVGGGFVDGTVVLLDGVPAAAKVVDAEHIDVTTPGGKDGTMIDVTVQNPDGKQAVEVRAFAYDVRYD